MDDTAPGPQSAAVSKGVALVAAYRAARIAGRPTIKRELQAARAKMLHSLGRASVSTLAEAAPQAECAGPAMEDMGQIGQVAHAACLSVFAGLVDAHMPDPPPAQEVEAPALSAPQRAEPESEAKGADRGAEREGGGGGDVAAYGGAAAEVTAAERAPCPNLEVGLEVLGLGPGMLMRLNQLGIHSAADLAARQPDGLRASLGDISRLVNVEAWIDRARCAMG